MKRFIVLIGEEATVYQTDDEYLVQQWSEDEFTIAIDTITGLHYSSGNEEGAEIAELPEYP